MNLLAHSRPATHRQLSAMRAVARDYGIDYVERSKVLFNKEPDELSEYEAGVMIDYLRVAPGDNNFLERAHNPETCGCQSDAEWCPYNPASSEFFGKIVKPTKPHEAMKGDC